MSGTIIEDQEEVNQMLHEITEYTALGLVSEDVDEKQFYLERIWISLGISLAKIRQELGVKEGKNPDNHVLR